LLGSVGVLSAFVNNTPVVILFIPIVLHVACLHGFKPSEFLIPVSYVSILGGTCTLVGTSTNIIVSNVAEDLGFAPLSMFELAWAGLPIALAGAAYLLFVAPRLLPSHRGHACAPQGEDADAQRYLSEWSVAGGGSFDGLTLQGSHLPGDLDDVEVLEVLHESGRIADPESRAVELGANDVLVLKASAAQLLRLAKAGNLHAVPVAHPRPPEPLEGEDDPGTGSPGEADFDRSQDTGDTGDTEHAHAEDAEDDESLGVNAPKEAADGDSRAARNLSEEPEASPRQDGLARLLPGGRRDELVELIVPSGSRYVDRPIQEAVGWIDTPVRVLGVKRRARHYRSESLGPMRLQPGDVLLAHCARPCHDELADAGNLIVVGDVTHTVKNRRRAPLAVGILAAMIAAVALGVAPMITASLTAAVLMIVTGCVRLPVALRSVDVHVLLLIIGTIALGTAMQRSGTAELYADTVLGLLRGAGPHLVLGGVILFTSIMSNFVSNNSTAVLVLPLAASMASSLGVDPRPFVVGTALGASAAFASPVGYQTNLLVYGPGSYTFVDFVKAGLPLNLLVCLLATLLVPLAWPL
jgi:di/tricarboxylate transporter